MNPRFELAHLAHAELLTPNMEGTLWFFTELLGMRTVARQGDSVYLRCYEDPYHHSLKVTAADAPGLANLGWRTTSAEALERTRGSARGSGGRVKTGQEIASLHHVGPGDGPGRQWRARADRWWWVSPGDDQSDVGAWARG